MPLKKNVAKGLVATMDKEKAESVVQTKQLWNTSSAVVATKKNRRVCKTSVAFQSLQKWPALLNEMKLGTKFHTIYHLDEVRPKDDYQSDFEHV